MNRNDVMTRYNLPAEVKFCKKCVMSNQRPRITFDEHGVCSACNFAEYKHGGIDWSKREEALLRLLDKHRKSNGEFDVIVPCSGGKDSTFVAWELKHRYGMNPLTVTWAPHLPTEVGVKNLHNFVAAGFSNILGSPNGQVHRTLTRLSFLHLGDPFQAFIYGQKAFPMRIATMYNIPLIMYGENGEVEYGGDMKNVNNPMHNLRDDLEKHYFSGMGPLSWLDYGLTRQEVLEYMPPAIDAMEALGIQCHFFGYYRKWNPHANALLAAEKTGFTPASQRSEGTYTNYASLDDRIDGMHYYLAYIKFGIGRCTADAAHEIRDGKLSREEAVALVHSYDGEFPARYHDDFLEYIGITDEKCHKTIDSWRSPHLWTKAGATWHLKHRLV